jgi:hypothetical protein
MEVHDKKNPQKKYHETKTPPNKFGKLNQKVVKESKS